MLTQISGNTVIHLLWVYNPLTLCKAKADPLSESIENDPKPANKEQDLSSDRPIALG